MRRLWYNLYVYHTSYALGVVQNRNDRIKNLPAVLTEGIERFLGRMESKHW